MICLNCNRELTIASTKFVSDIGSIDVFVEQALCCINPKCINYAGKDLSKPEKITAVIRNNANVEVDANGEMLQ